jgi:hypothetical protein
MGLKGHVIGAKEFALLLTVLVGGRCIRRWSSCSAG